jgi:protein N-terminal asparagine amidohydrolase
LQETSSKFLANKIEEQAPLKCLYVGQREYATVQSNDPLIDIVGSDDATTCHIVLIVDESIN